MKDYGDQEVKGMDRYIPTHRSKVLLVLLITVPTSLFAFLVQSHNFLLAEVSEAARMPTIFAFSFGLALIIATGLAIELHFPHFSGHT